MRLSRISLVLPLLLIALVSCKKDLGEPCDGDGECAAGECAITFVGVGNRVKSCTEQCDRDEDCGEGATCHLGNYCARSCSSEDPCTGEAVCEPSFQLCVAPCSSDADCDQEVCRDGLCQ